MAISTIGTNSLSDPIAVNGYTPTASNMQPFNRIINGAMTVDQRNAGASVSATSGAFSVDRFLCDVGGLSNYTAQRSSTAPAGFTNSLLLTMGTNATIDATDYAFFRQYIEGFNTADLGLGTANASPFTLSFWVRSSVIGTFGVSFRNNAANATYCSTYTISAANTWEYKTVAVPSITAGTWTTDNTVGLGVFWDLGVGSTYSGTAGQLNTGGNFFGVSSTTKLAATSGATFYITGVQLEAGSTASPFAHEFVGDTLQKCQRYLPTLTTSQAGSVSTIGQGLSTTLARVVIPFTVTPRVQPTGVTVISVGNFGIVTTGSGGVAASAITFNSASFSGVSVDVTVGAYLTNNGAHIMYQSSPAQLLFTGCEL